MAGRVGRLGAVGAIAVVAAGCGSSDTPTAATIASTMPPLTTVATTTTLPSLDPGLVQDCVDYVQFGAFTGNVLLSAMWNEAGANIDTLRLNCEALGRSDPQSFAGMSVQWHDIQLWIEAGTDASTTTAAP